MDQMKTYRKSRSSSSAVQLLDEAVHLLRAAPLDLLPSYYIGSLPFVLGLLYFWAETSLGPASPVDCAAASFGLALLFGWMKLWQAEFARRVQIQIRDCGETVSASHRWRLGLQIQGLLQPTGLLALPIAALLVLPLARCFAFYQHLTSCPPDGVQELRTAFRLTWQLSGRWPRQNYIILGALSIFAIVVAVNLGIAVFLLPHLVKMLLGVGSVFTLSGASVANTTFWAAVIGLTYLVLDPVVKSVYALRSFHGQALRSGLDLKSELDACRRLHQNAAAS
jgi:hypothetical protein